ncbi:MAG TPA: hypothetical protein VNS62_06005 [Candidatus Udaeobacter sp.]|nr:hypothetical protein [Candidatus Udaeobacter sp.]
MTAREQALHDALRKHAIQKTANVNGRLLYCAECDTSWPPGAEECHFAGCLAAPTVNEEKEQSDDLNRLREALGDEIGTPTLGAEPK